jgi:hypothetical protein
MPTALMLGFARNPIFSNQFNNFVFCKLIINYALPSFQSRSDKMSVENLRTLSTQSRRDGTLTMANTYSKIHLQFVFAPKFRASLIQPSWENDLFKYITGIVQNNKHKMLCINGGKQVMVSSHIPNRRSPM